MHFGDVGGRYRGGGGRGVAPGERAVDQPSEKGDIVPIAKKEGRANRAHRRTVTV